MSSSDGSGSDIDQLWREHRSYVVDLAFRMLGGIQDAEDVVQEAFARLLGADIDEIDDVRGWLVVVVSRLCLDHLRARTVRRQATAGSLDAGAGLDGRASPMTLPLGSDPADRVTLDDGVRMALLVVLQQLSPAERAVFVLHDVFGFAFDDVAGIVGRSPASCRQLASRARRRIEDETQPARFHPEVNEQHAVSERFIAACAGGDLETLMQMLDPHVVGDVNLGSLGRPRRPLHGYKVVSRNLLSFFGPETGATLVSQPVNGMPGALAFRDGDLVAILQFKIRDGLICDLHAVADPIQLAFASRLLASN